jgi:hypothetical protein
MELSLNEQILLYKDLNENMTLFQKQIKNYVYDVFCPKYAKELSGDYNKVRFILESNMPFNMPYLRVDFEQLDYWLIFNFNNDNGKLSFGAQYDLFRLNNLDHTFISEQVIIEPTERLSEAFKFLEKKLREREMKKIYK